MKTKVIDKIIKPETRRKATEAVKNGMRTLVTWGPYLAFCATICAAWDGCTRASRNERKIDSQQNTIDGLIKVVNHNADVNNNTIDRVDDLEENQKKLFEKAIDITEGKDGSEPEPAEKSA